MADFKPRPPFERVEKLDAVRRQLRTAIRLFFEERDNVSIYTLVAAVQELLRGLLKPREEGSFIKDTDLVRPEKRKEFLGIINKPQNFFKHADSDRDEVLEFNPELTTFVIVDCVEMYQKYTGRVLREGFVFSIWFAMNYSELLIPGAFADAIEEVKRQAASIGIGKAFFLSLLNRADLWPNTD